MTWSYSGDPSDSDLDAVRFEVQDTNLSAQLLQDAEVSYVILYETGVAAGTPATISGGNLYAAAAHCCEVVAQGFLATADTQVGQLKITSTKRAEQYVTRAKELRLKAQGFYAPYSGGQSISEKESFHQDSDAVQPAFTRTQWNSPFTGNQDGFADEDFGPPVG